MRSVGRYVVDFHNQIRFRLKSKSFAMLGVLFDLMLPGRCVSACGLPGWSGPTQDDRSICAVLCHFHFWCVFYSTHLFLVFSTQPHL